MSVVLVTGATGLLGSHVVQQLLDAGYTVRGAARSATAERLRANYTSFGDKFEVAVIDDVATSDASSALKGVDALIHVASPLVGKGSAETVLQSAIDGTVNILKQAADAGVKKIVVTGSIIALLGLTPAYLQGGQKYNENDWSPITREDALKPDATPLTIYGASKKLAEEAVWQFAREHPDVDVTTILPPYLFGPTGRGQVLNGPSSSTNRFIYSLITGPKGRPVQPQISIASFIHIADAARAHVLALKAPPSTPDEPKRIIVGKYEGTWREAVAHIAKARPELRERLPVVEGVDEIKWATFDTRRAERVLGLTEYKNWEQTVEETVDDLSAREKEFGVVPK